MTRHDTKHYEMLSTQKGVREGEIHPVVFTQGETYKLDDSLKAQFESLEAIKPSAAEAKEPTATHEAAPEVWKEPNNENVLDEDPAVLRHAEIPVDAVHAQNDAAQAKGDMTPEAEVALGRAGNEPLGEPEMAAEGEKPAKSAKKGK